MIARLRLWFAGRSLRERRMILVMLALAAVTFAWAGVILPLGDALSNARGRHDAAVIRLGETRAALDALADLRRDHPTPLNGPLEAAVRTSADQAGFTLTTLNAEGPDRVQIAIATARPAALFSWIAGLEASGILVDSAKVSDNGDKTVGLQATLKARGA